MTKQDLALNYGGKVRAVRWTLTYLDLQATSGSGAKEIALADGDNPSQTFLIPAYGKILGVSVAHTVAFAGGSLSAMTVSLGVHGALTRFTAAFDIFQAVSDTALQETDMFKLGQKSAVGLAVSFTPTGDNCSVATAGSVFIDVYYMDMSTTFTLPA